MSFLTSWGNNVLLTFILQWSAFVLSFWMQTEKLYDVSGGLNFLCSGILSFLPNKESSLKKELFTFIFLMSRGWLTIFLAWRAHDRGGDSRFDGVVNNGPVFFVYWTFQAIWVSLISMPLLYVNDSINAANDDWSVPEIITLTGFAFGVVFEIIADIQKTLWIKRGRPGHFMRSGVWKYSRHANYFGEVCQWSFAWIFSGFVQGDKNYFLTDKSWWFCSLSPLFTAYLLLFLSGTGMTQANHPSQVRRYYVASPDEYQRYRDETSPLIPFPFYSKVPSTLKQTIFFEWDRYNRYNHSIDQKMKST